jgi:hypothetical protein
VQEETFGAKVAVTVLAALIDRVQVLAEPLQAPPQPVKVLPDAAAAVRVTLTPDEKLAEQVLPQEMPPTLLVTVPVPVPLLVTASV